MIFGEVLKQRGLATPVFMDVYGSVHGSQRVEPMPVEVRVALRCVKRLHVMMMCACGSCKTWSTDGRHVFCLFGLGGARLFGQKLRSSRYCFEKKHAN